MLKLRSLQDFSFSRNLAFLYVKQEKASLVSIFDLARTSPAESAR